MYSVLVLSTCTQYLYSVPCVFQLTQVLALDVVVTFRSRQTWDGHTPEPHSIEITVEFRFFLYLCTMYSSTPVRHSTWYSSTGVQYVIFVRVLMYSFVLEYCTVQRTHTICTTVLDYSTVRRTHRYFC